MSTDRHWSRAQRYLSEGQATAARIALETLLQRDPSHVPAQLMLSRVAWMEDRVRDASRYALQASRELPADASLIGDAVEALFNAGETTAARGCLEHPALANVQDGKLLVRLASLRKLLGEHAEALALLDRAGEAGVDDADFHFQRALELTFNGRLPEAEGEYNAALDINPTLGRASLAIARLRRQTAESNHLDELAARIAAVERGSEDHVALEFARYKELEDLARFDEAWDALTHGNALKYKVQPYDAGYTWGLFEALMKRCTPELVQAEQVRFDGAQPIFIIGMPRSGTTLLDRILGNHSQVVSAGELDDFGRQLRWGADHRVTLDERILERLPDLDYREIGRRYLAQTQWRAGGAMRYIDKLPRNWMVAGLIRRALPQARILNLVRQPMDVCFSNFRALLGEAFSYSYDLDALAAHYLQYRRVMDHWHRIMPGQILDVSYSELVQQPEKVAREVFAFCGLEWEPGCVDLTRNKTVVATLSMAQVREPIHTRSFEEWRPYEQHLGKLRDSLPAH